MSNIESDSGAATGRQDVVELGRPIELGLAAIAIGGPAAVELFDPSASWVTRLAVGGIAAIAGAKLILDAHRAGI